MTDTDPQDAMIRLVVRGRTFVERAMGLHGKKVSVAHLAGALAVRHA